MNIQFKRFITTDEEFNKLKRYINNLSIKIPYYIPLIIAKCSYPNGKTNLMFYAMNNDKKNTEYLIEFGADVNDRDDANETALHYATEYKNLDIIKYLVNNGADINAKNDSDITPLDYALKSLPTPKNIIKYLKDNGGKEGRDKDGRTILIKSSLNNDYSLLGTLLWNGANVNTQDNYENTALMYAVKNNNLDMVKKLIEHNIDISIENSDNKTALNIAKEKGYIKIFNYLNKELKRKKVNK